MAARRPGRGLGTATNSINGNRSRSSVPGEKPSKPEEPEQEEEEEGGEEDPEDEGQQDDDGGAEDGDEFFEDDEEELGGEEGEAKPRNTLDSISWNETYVCPFEIRFTQEKVHPFFHRRGPIANVLPKIRPVLRKSDQPGEEAEIELVPPFPPIHCLQNSDEFWTLDNRRLYALQQVAIEHWPQRCRVKILCRERLPRQRFRSQYRKFNTTSGGRSIVVSARYQKFDHWSWFDRGVEFEWWTFNQRLGWLLSLFEILPVVGALLFRTGLTGFSSRIPLVAGFILAFACDLLRQRVPTMEKRLCELHVQAIMDGEVRPLCPSLGKVWAVVREKIWGPDDGYFNGPLSMPQLAASVALTMLLVLPYMLGIAAARLRSSLLSCWLGIACVLAVQVGGAFSRGAVAPPRLSPQSITKRSSGNLSKGSGSSDALTSVKRSAAAEAESTEQD